jgi:predicted transcriptional regulator
MGFMTKNAQSTNELGPLSREVMEVVWAAGGPVSVRQVVEQLNSARSEPLAYTTVMTVMARLAEKETLARQRAGRGFVYEATAPDAAGIAVRNVIRAYGDEAMAHFVDEARSNPDTLRRLQHLIAEG